MRNRRLSLQSFVLMFVAIGIIGCSSSDGSTPPETSAPRADATGEQIFLSVGCAACHGQGGEGSAIAPSLPGHSQEQVRRQVRAPIGAMPRFGVNAISDSELDRLAEYIEGLSGTEEHQEPIGLELEAVVAMHHWMAISALKADKVSEAQHHIQHAIESIADLSHQEQMEAVLVNLDGGRLHDAEHAIEGMLVGTAEPELTVEELHLQMSLSAISVEDEDDATHHLEHFLEDATAPSREIATETIALLASGEFHDAEEEVQEMLEGMPHLQHHH